MKFRSLFSTPKPIIGMIALPPLLGYPEFTTISAYIDYVLRDLEALTRGGVDAVCVENDFDHPHTLTAGPEIVAAMTRLTCEIRANTQLPVGVEVLLNDWQASLAVAQAAQAQFVRLDFFVDHVRIAAGEIKPNPQAVLAYRKRIGAEQVALFTDIQVKYSQLLEPNKPIAASALQAIAHGSDALIVTGNATGERPTTDDLQAVRVAVGDFPILVGSGTNPQNVNALLRFADGAIVGSALKASYAPFVPVEVARVKALTSALHLLNK